MRVVPTAYVLFTFALVSTVSGQTLTNVKGADAVSLVGSQCRANFWVPGLDRTDNGKGAMGLEFSEASALLSVATSSRFGVEADKRAMDPAFELQPVGVGSNLEVNGRKVTFVDAKGGKFDLGFKADNSFKGTIDPRGTPGRERWSVAMLEGKCTAR